MNKRIQELAMKLFEEHTVPQFGPSSKDLTLKDRGVYADPIIEDHWQTFQEAVELAIKHSMEHLKDNDCTVQALQLQSFWYK